MSKRAVIIDITTDPSGFKKGSKQAEQAADSFSDRLENVGKAMAMAYSAKVVVDFGAQAVKAAAADAAAQVTLANALRNTTAATDEQIASVEDWISATAMQLGIADDQLRPALATLVGATKDVAEAQDLMALAMDTARAKGLPLEQVANALAKGHSGQITALTRLIPGLRQAGETSLSFADATARLNEQVRGQAEAFAQTDLGKLERMQVSWGEMQEQIGTALLPVMGQLLDVVGGLFDWFNSLDESTQSLIVTIGLVGAGMYVAVSAAASLTSAVKVLGLTTAAAQPWLLGLAAATVAVVAAVAIFSEEQTSAEKATTALSESLSVAAKSIDAHELAMLSATEAAEKYAAAMFAEHDEKIRQQIRDNKRLQEGLVELGIGMEEVVAATHDDAAAQALANKAREEAARRGFDLVVSMEDLETASGRTEYAMFSIVQLLEDQAVASARTTEENILAAEGGDLLAASTLKATGAYADLTTEQQAMVDALLATAPALDDATTGTENLGDEAADTATEMEVLVDITDELRRAFDSIIGPSMSLEQSQRRIRDAAADTVEAFKKHGATLDINTEAGRSNREAVQAQAEAILQLGENMIGAGASTEDASNAMLIHTQALRDVMEQAGMTDEQIDDYLETLGLTPENITTSVELANENATRTALEDILGQLGDVDEGAMAEIRADIAEGDFEAAVKKINSLPDKDVTVRLVPGGASLKVGSSGGGGGGLIKWMAEGGTLAPGEWGVAGETGQPEIVETPTLVRGPARVTGVRDTARAMKGGGGGGGPQVTVNMRNGPSAAEVARELTWMWRVAR